MMNDDYSYRQAHINFKSYLDDVMPKLMSGELTDKENPKFNQKNTDTKYKVLKQYAKVAKNMIRNQGQMPDEMSSENRIMLETDANEFDRIAGELAPYVSFTTGGKKRKRTRKYRKSNKYRKSKRHYKK